MPISDVKKCQSMINTLGQQIEILRAAVDAIKAIHADFQTADPDPTGTPLEGGAVIIDSPLTALDNAVNSGAAALFWDQMIAAVVPSHRNVALEE